MRASTHQVSPAHGRLPLPPLLPLLTLLPSLPSPLLPSPYRCPAVSTAGKPKKDAELVLVQRMNLRSVIWHARDRVLINAGVTRAAELDSSRFVLRKVDKVEEESRGRYRYLTVITVTFC